MGYRSNIDAVIAKVRRVPDVLDFNQPGRGGGTLGDDLLNIISDDIISQTVDRQEGFEGERLEDNEPRYAARKGHRPVSVGVTGTMMSDAQIRGRRTIQEIHAEQQFGLDARTIQIADWFYDGNREQRQPYRHFYGISAASEANVRAYCELHAQERFRRDGW